MKKVEEMRAEYRREDLGPLVRGKYAAKYAKATEVQVQVGSRDGRVEVTVRDNGVGFDTKLPRLATHGLLGMKFRVESENGEMTIESAPGRGTSIRAVLPEAEASAGDESAGLAAAQPLTA